MPGWSIPAGARTAFFRPLAPGARGEAYLCVSALTPYKRLDIVVDACISARPAPRRHRHGPELARVAPPRGTYGDASQAGSLTRCVRDAVRRGAAPFLFPGEEEFGIAPLEGHGGGPAGRRLLAAAPWRKRWWTG